MGGKYAAVRARRVNAMRTKALLIDAIIYWVGSVTVVEEERNDRIADTGNADSFYKQGKGPTLGRAETLRWRRRRTSGVLFSVFSVLGTFELKSSNFNIAPKNAFLLPTASFFRTSPCNCCSIAEMRMLLASFSFANGL